MQEKDRLFFQQKGSVLADAGKPGTQDAGTAIRICDVEKYYGNGSHVTKAVDRVSFTVRQGEFIGVMGASGSGKTTLLNLLSTIDTVTAGHIYYTLSDSGSCPPARRAFNMGCPEGYTLSDSGSCPSARRAFDTGCPNSEVDITELSEDRLSDFRKNNLGFVFQEYNLLDTLTLEENIMLAMTLRRQKKEEIQKRCTELLELLGIADVKAQFPYQVSGGQKQRCACARALANRPRLLLADEPTGALDSHSAQTLLETFTEMNEKLKATIFMVTHDAFSASYCGRILFLKDGKIFHELVRGEKTRREFLNEILDVLSLTGGEFSHAE